MRRVRNPIRVYTKANHTYVRCRVCLDRISRGEDAVKWWSRENSNGYTYYDAWNHAHLGCWLERGSGSDFIRNVMDRLSDDEIRDMGFGVETEQGEPASEFNMVTDLVDGDIVIGLDRDIRVEGIGRNHDRYEVLSNTEYVFIGYAESRINIARLGSFRRRSDDEHITCCVARFRFVRRPSAPIAQTRENLVTGARIRILERGVAGSTVNDRPVEVGDEFEILHTHSMGINVRSGVAGNFNLNYERLGEGFEIVFVPDSVGR